MSDFHHDSLAATEGSASLQDMTEMSSRSSAALFLIDSAHVGSVSSERRLRQADGRRGFFMSAARLSGVQTSCALNVFEDCLRPSEQLSPCSL